MRWMGSGRTGTGRGGKGIFKAPLTLGFRDSLLLRPSGRWMQQGGMKLGPYQELEAAPNTVWCVDSCTILASQ